MMFSYIASFLGYQGQSNSTNDNEDIHSVSCEGYGYSLPDPAVRLRLSSTDDSIVRIFGHPPQEDYPEAMHYPGSTMGTEGPPFVHYLYNPGPACLKYVMGDNNNWRSQLRSDHQSRLKFLEGDVLLRPAYSGNSDDTCCSAVDDDPAVKAEEQAHSLRMRRCGAVAIFAENDIGDYECGWLYPPPTGHHYLFGWPKSGGVWVLRAPSIGPRPELPVGVRQTQQESMDSNMERAKENRAFRTVAKSSKQQEDMEDVCRVLEESGAHFHALIEDCSEAVELNLVHPAQASTIRLRG
jgi:hypothetical protein